MKEELLRIEKLSKVFTVGLFSKKSIWAVKEVSFEIGYGEIFSLVGESGSGKSTIGKVILRLEKPTSGRVLFEGKDPFQMGKEYTRLVSVVFQKPTSGRVLFEGKDPFQMGKEYTRLVSVVFQDPRSSLNPRMKVGEIVQEPLLVHKEKDRKEKVLQALLMAGLEESFLERRPEELSGGQRQRVAIARAIVLKPKLIVADEPTSALDMSYRAGILELFLTLKEEGISTLLITHDIRAVERVSDRVGVLYRGKLVELGLSKDVLKNPLQI